MHDIVRAGDAFIWITSIVAGLASLYAGYRWAHRKSLSPRDRALVGEWYAYAHFPGRTGDLFFKERVSIRTKLFPLGQLAVTTRPETDDSDTVYQGRIRTDPPFLFCTTEEPIYGDRTFGIGKRVMDERHDASTIVWLCMGKGYDDNVHCATAGLWTRKQLDPQASTTRSADPEVEKARFLELVAPYFDVSPDTLQLRLR